MRLSVFVILSLLYSSIFAQDKVIPYPRLSPLEKTEIQIAMVDFKLEYSKPSMRGRKIFGGLETFGEVWRTGANKNIKLSFNEPIVVHSDTLSAGTYTILTKPDLDQWTIYFYDHIDRFGVPKDLDTFEIRSSFNVKPQSLNHAVETMDISFGNLTYGSGDIVIKWENTSISIPFTIPYTSIIDDRLRKVINTLASDYSTTASIYYDKNDDPVTAMRYLDLAIMTRENGQSFDQWLSNLKDKDLGLPWAHLVKAEIYADRKDFKNAIKQAELSLKIAEVVGSRYYIKENSANISSWSVLKKE